MNHPLEVNIKARPYFEAMLAEAEALSPAHVEALKEQRARQLANFLPAMVQNA